MMRYMYALAAFFAASLLSLQVSLAQTAYFNDPTDTIEIDGQTEIGDASTYELVFLWAGDGDPSGMFFDEWKNGAEDKQLQLAQLGAGSHVVHALNWPATRFVSAEMTVTPNTWHHVAFVYDGVKERLYIDGFLQYSDTRSSGPVANSDGKGHIGATPRLPEFATSFYGYLESFRLSDVARYTGDAFTPPTGDLTSDANTLLLYNFEEPVGSTTVADSGPLGRTGTLGTGFSGATSPVLGPVGVAEEPRPDAPVATLGAAQPNPFSTTTRLSFTLLTPEHVRLTLHDVQGRELRVLMDGDQGIGRHELALDAEGLAPGVYLVRMTAGDHVVSSQTLVLTL